MSARTGLAFAIATLVAILPASPASARTIDAIPVPGLRVMGHAIWHVDPGRTAVGGLDILPQLTLLDVEDGWRLTFLAGYGFESGGDTHLAQLGVELGAFPSWLYGVDVGLRGLVGSSDGEAGGGLRAVAGGELFFGAFRAEVAYQLLGSDRGVEHDLRIGVGIDLLRAIVALAL